MSRFFPTIEKTEKFLSQISSFSGERKDLFSYPGNTWFNGADVDVLYSFVRTFEPITIREFGVGYTSIIMSEAWKQYENKFNEHVAVDPDVSSFARCSVISLKKFKGEKKKTENIPLATFKEMKPGDLVFIDSGHSAEQASFYLQNIFPLLPIGCFVHIHDIDFVDFNLSRCEVGHAGSNSGEETVLLNYLQKDDCRLDVIYCNHIIHHNADLQNLYQRYMKYSGDNFGASLYGVIV